MAILENYLADLPDLVTQEVLAIKLGIKIKTVYQRHWRQKQNPKLNVLPPPVLPIPGCIRMGASKEAVITWWISAGKFATVKRASRPTKAEQVAKHEISS